MQEARDIAGLCGWELSTVAFVRDYVEFHFDGPVLRWFLLPVISIGAVDLEPGGEGYRDALCELIGAEVTSTVDDGQRVGLTFGDARLEIPRHGEHTVWEVASFSPWVNGEPDVSGPIEWENLARPGQSIH